MYIKVHKIRGLNLLTLPRNETMKTICIFTSNFTYKFKIKIKESASIYSF